MGFHWSELIGWLAWSIALAETFRAIRSDDAPRARWWRTALIVAFAAFRWPSWTNPQEFSPDESLALSGALTLWSDPLFFRSVDGTTAGPLHVYMLMPAALGAGDYGYFLARLIGHMLLLGTLFLAGGIVRRFDRVAEPLAVIAAVSAFGFTRATDFQHASTELLPCFLIVGAISLNLRSPLHRPALWGVGFALGAAPWAKLQVGPIALGVGVTFVVMEWRRGRLRAALEMVLSAFLPTALVVAVTASTGLWKDMVIPYLLANTIYVAASRYSIFSALRGFLTALTEDGQSGLFLAMGGAIILISYAVARTISTSLKTMTWAIWGWLALSLFCVATARRPFLHYWHLLAPPWMVLVGLAVARIRAQPRPLGQAAIVGWSVAALVALILPLAVYRVAGPDKFLWARQLFERYHRQNEELAELTRPFLRHADSMAIWGNRSGLYIEMGTPQGVRQGHSGQVQLRPKNEQGYFLRVYWEEFARRRPAVFVDASGGENLGFDTPNQPHEAFRILAEVIRRDYTLLVQRYGTRIYLRNDRVSAAQLAEDP
jgi:hypothetical protein